MHSHGIEWSKERLGVLIDLRASGCTAPEISDQLSRKWNMPVSIDCVNNAIYRHQVGRYLIERDKHIKVYDEEMRITADSAIISSDWHAPYYSEVWVNRMLQFAHKYGIKTHVIGGDWMDMGFAKWSKFKMMENIGERESNLDEEIERVQAVFNACKLYDRTYLICGNHENRVDRLTEGKIQARHIIDLMGGKEMEGLTVSVYDKLYINDDILVVHPKSYSQISGSVAVRLAEKTHRHVLNAHGHFMAMRYDRSAKFMCCDIGGMFDITKIDYICKKTTTHPTWNNGFAVIMDGGIELIHGGNLKVWGLK
jgi:hypothetical protein